MGPWYWQPGFRRKGLVYNDLIFCSMLQCYITTVKHQCRCRLKQMMWVNTPIVYSDFLCDEMIQCTPDISFFNTKTCKWCPIAPSGGGGGGGAKCEMRWLLFVQTMFYHSVVVLRKDRVKLDRVIWSVSAIVECRDRTADLELWYFLYTGRLHCIERGRAHTRIHKSNSHFSGFISLSTVTDTQPLVTKVWLHRLDKINTICTSQQYWFLIIEFHCAILACSTNRKLSYLCLMISSVPKK